MRAHLVIQIDALQQQLERFTIHFVAAESELEDHVLELLLVDVPAVVLVECLDGVSE